MIGLRTPPPAKLWRGVVASFTERPTPPIKRHAPRHMLGRRMHHALGFLDGEPVEFAGIAVGNENMHAGIHRAIHDRGQKLRGEPVIRIEKGVTRIPDMPVNAWRSCA